ncbi:MAG: hypothetical protein HYW65_01615 [Candidatus Liptonbacteria bacterium]|nr:hypothetical protein [Candidatus Liptonbacteria bacterium]
MPQFEPHKWHSCEKHDNQTCVEGVNCYSYTLNHPEYHWAVPGIGFAHVKRKIYADSFNAYFQNIPLAEFREQLTKGAARDGLTKVENPVEQDGYYLTALFFASDKYDFHWYRKDGNGLWSHKDGWQPPSNKDEQGNLIRDPREAVNSKYPIFGGFFLVPRTGITLKEDFPLIP